MASLASEISQGTGKPLSVTILHGSPPLRLLSCPWFCRTLLLRTLVHQTERLTSWTKRPSRTPWPASHPLRHVRLFRGQWSKAPLLAHDLERVPSLDAPLTSPMSGLPDTWPAFLPFRQRSTCPLGGRLVSRPPSTTSIRNQGRKSV